MAIISLLLFGCLGLAILLFLQYHLYSNHGNLFQKEELRILILGLPKSGKTYIWQRLTSDLPPKPTITSLAPNRAVFVPSYNDTDSLTQAERKDLFGKIHIHDLPGRFDQHQSIVENEIKNAIGLVFVIDSCDHENVRAASSFLYNILSSRAYQSKPKPLCLFFNKQNEPGARHKNLLREDVEREIEKSRRLNESHHVPKAEIPVIPTSLLGRLLLRVGWYPKRLRREQSSDITVSLTKTASSMFRLANLNSPYFLLIQDSSFEVALERLKGFVQRSSMLL